MYHLGSDILFLAPCFTWRLAGNGVGSVRDCQAMLDFAGKHGITADVEVVKMDYVNTAVERLEKNDVRYRFVIDVAGSQLGAAA